MMMSYKEYIERFCDDGGRMLPAQLLYDWRAVTGFISGIDLHDAFYGLLGEPSPSGYRGIPAEKAAQFIARFRDEISSEDAFLADAKKYAQKSNGKLDWGVDAVSSLEDVSQLWLALKKWDDGRPAGEFKFPRVYR